ncbi:hypothetical protein ILUMI_15427 [Ignelater luminosus]|uniref:CBM39 domain-containing protein n=1 Tax=Ignelater luminosus TaxID=2038154 RepID=A0A8K0G9I7_IGNLU|nr:hypothetical protein ILUMI_15427 [Ignelater luminosus]
MSATRCLLCALTISVFLSLINGNVVKIPIPSIIAYEPYGIKVTLPNVDGISEFFFWGNVNEELESTDLGTIRLHVLEPTNGKWVVEDTSVSLNQGDVIHYTLFVKINGIMHKLNGVSHQVKELIPRPLADLSSEVEKTNPCKNKEVTINIKTDSHEIKPVDKEETVDFDKLSSIYITDCQIELETSSKNANSDSLEVIVAK